MTFTSKELRTKTIWSSPERPGYTIERTHLIGADPSFKVYETQRITSLHVTSECIGVFSNFDEATGFLTW